MSEPAFSQPKLRRLHRWIGFPATLFLLWVSFTGIWLAAAEFFGEDEALRERTRDMVSAVTLDAPDAGFAAMLAKARAAAAVNAPGAPLDKVVWQFKGDAPTVTFYTGKMEGGENKQIVVSAKTFTVESVEDTADKPLLLRLHSGEAFGDGVWRLQVPLLSGKTAGSNYHFAEIGYQWAFDDGASDMLYGGYGVLHNFNKHFAPGTELYGWMPADDSDTYQLVTTLGGVYTFNEHFSLKASISHSLRDTDRGGPAPSGVFYAVWNF